MSTRSVSAGLAPGSAGRASVAVAARLTSFQRLDGHARDARHLQQALHGLRALVGEDGELDRGDLLQSLHRLHRRIQVANFTYVRQLAGKQLGFQADQGKICLKNDLTDEHVVALFRQDHVGKTPAQVVADLGGRDGGRLGRAFRRREKRCGGWRDGGRSRRRLVRRAGGQQLFGQGRKSVVQDLAALQGVDALPQAVGARQQGVGDLRRRNAPLVDEGLQEVFHQVRELRDAVQADRGRRAFHAVRGDEELLHLLFAAAGFERQQGLDQLIDRRLGLVDEDRKVLRSALPIVFEIGE